MAGRWTLRIPDDTISGLKLLMALTPHQRAALEQVLREAAPRLHSVEYAESVSAEIDHDEEAIQTIVESLIALYTARSQRALSVEEFSDHVIGVVGDRVFDEDSEGSREIFTGVLIRFLNLGGSLGITAKAINVLFQHEHHLCSVRILTDLRPVFFDEPAEQPMAGFIVHTVKISYHEGDEVKEFFVALDGEDIHEFERMIARANEKAKGLRSMMRETGMTDLDPEVS